MWYVFITWVFYVIRILRHPSLNEFCSKAEKDKLENGYTKKNTLFVYIYAKRDGKSVSQ